MIFDVNKIVPQEVFFLNATNQFISPERYVDPGIIMAICTTESFQSRDSFLFTEIKQNRSKEMCIITQDRKVFRKNFNWADTERNNVCKGVFRMYAEVDLQELARIMKRVVSNNKIQNIDMQTALSTFKGHTMFSIFCNSVSVHE